MYKYITQIVALPLGANILGLLEFFAFLGITTCPLTLEEMPRFGLAIGLLLGVFGVSGFDCFVRSRRPQPEGRSRFLTLRDGGCLCFVPVWLLIPGFILSVAIAGFVASQMKS